MAVHIEGETTWHALLVLGLEATVPIESLRSSARLPDSPRRVGRVVSDGVRGVRQGALQAGDQSQVPMEKHGKSPVGPRASRHQDFGGGNLMTVKNAGSAFLI